MVLFFFVFLFFVWEKTNKGYFPAILEFFFFFVSPKGLSLKSFFSSYSVFFSGFPFVCPFKTPFFLCFLSINPFLENIDILVSLSFFFLPFPFLMFVCFFQTNFPNIPFWNPSCFHVWLFYLFLQLFLFLFSCFMFLPFCFDVGFVFGMFYVVLVLFLFCFLFCFHRLWKTLFPCNSSVFSHVGYKVVLYFVQFHVFVLVCFSCVVCFHF